MDSDVGCITMEMYLKSMNCTPKMVKMVNFVILSQEEKILP